MIEKLVKLFKEGLKDSQSERSMIKHPFGCSLTKQRKASGGVSCTVILRQHCFQHKNEVLINVRIVTSVLRVQAYGFWTINTPTKTFLTFSW